MNPLLLIRSIRMKMFILVTFVLLGSIFAVLWKTRQIFFEDKYDFIRQLSNKLSSSSGRLTQEKLFELQNKLALFVSTHQSLGKMKSSKDKQAVLFERFDELLTVSVQKQMPSNAWVTDWTEVNPNKDKNKWQETYVETILRGINYQTLGTGKISLGRFEDSEGQPFFAAYFLADLKADGDKPSSQLTTIVGFLKADFFKEIVMEYKGDLNTVFIVDGKGYIFAHPNDELVGHSIEDNPVVKEIASGRESGSGQFVTKDDEDIIANYSLIQGTNLYMVVTTPEKQAFIAARDLLITVLTFGVGFLIIGSVLSFALASRITKPLHELIDVAKLIGGGDFKVDVQVKSNDEVGELAESIAMMKSSLLERDEKIEHSKNALVQSEKMSAFGQLSAGIAHEVKNPLAGILGHAQLAKSKSKDQDVTKHLDMIERETRRTKEIIENLMRFARSEKPELKPTDLHESVSRAVDLVDHQLSLQGIKIIKDLHPVSPVYANTNQIQQVLLNIMMNAGHAMETCKVKQLTASVEDKGDVVQIRIKDTGAGMSPDVQKRIFEPFFTTKPAGKGTGLGLSVSIGIVQDHKGKIYVESAVGAGTTFFIDIPKTTSAQNTVAPVDAKVVTKADPKTVAKDETKLESKFSELTADTPKGKTRSKFPEFSAKVEVALDSEVRRDYLRSGANAEQSRSISDIKKEASKILRSEQEAKPVSGVEAQIESIKKEIKNTEAEIKIFNNSEAGPAVEAAAQNGVTPSSTEENKDDIFKVNIRKPKLKA